MNYTIINKIKDIKGTPAVTILMNTHRTFPENNQDSIRLKNMISEAGRRIIKEYGEQESRIITNKLTDLTSDLDYNYNLESLIIFASDDFIEYFRLPVSVKDKVIVDTKFSIKVLIRSLLQEESYYIICLSRKAIRLLEADNNNFAQEITDNTFPIVNDSYIDSDDIRKAWASTTDNYAREFYNKADKLFKNYYSKKPLPVILAGDRRNISFYKNNTDNPDIIIGFIEGNFDKSKPNEIAKETEKTINEYTQLKENKYLDEIAEANNEQKLLVDLNDIYRASKEGKGLKLFVEKDYFQPAIIQNNTVTLRDDSAEPGVVDDIVNEIIELVIKFGGSTAFMSVGRLKKYNKIVLVTRY